MHDTSSELRILLVDDHEDTLSVLKRLLRLEGHFVKATTTCQYGLEIARSESFDLVLSDIGLPDMDGCAFLQELRAIQPLKAIALTGYGMPDEVTRVMSAGFDEILVKPISFESLTQSIAKVISAGDVPRLSPKPYTPDPKVLIMKLYNYEKTLEMLSSSTERQKIEGQISQIRHRLAELGCKEG